METHSSSSTFKCWPWPRHSHQLQPEHCFCDIKQDINTEKRTNIVFCHTYLVFVPGVCGSETPGPEPLRGRDEPRHRERHPEAAVWGRGPPAAHHHLAVSLRQPVRRPGPDLSDGPGPGGQLRAVPGAGCVHLQGGEPAGRSREDVSGRYDSDHTSECVWPRPAAAVHRIHLLHETKRWPLVEYSEVMILKVAVDIFIYNFSLCSKCWLHSVKAVE